MISKTTLKTVPIHENVFNVLFNVILYYVFDDFFHVVFDMVFEVKFFNRDARRILLGNHCRTYPDVMPYDTDGTCVDVRFLIQIAE